ncbi:predicted protein [Nematostella vectensis]|uniref:Peptidase M14 domain-containing protein n=2 Tax=Nematostella vectensis TaxID=45351 RepID=A7RT36_NEMVE|nr:predicted protein [Nematostella vectensis]|eukprot:XP_001637384.1 predicted protein [Nematostella vectensis]
MDNLVRQHSQLATMQNLGNTYEGRPMKAVKISSGRGKKTFFMNCGIHAREWITQATCMYMLNQILYKYGKDQTVTAMLDKMDFVIMPILNVDGYVYTHTHNRMWRKTRKPYGGCYGADPNRNWSFKWGGVGTSSDPCRDTYRGPRPFSEVEALNVARYLYRNRKSLIGYMDIHAYSQLWMTSWGFNRAYPPAYNTKVKPAGQKAVEALRKVYGTHYRLGPSSIIIYATSGGTMDWATGVLGIEYSYGLELRDEGKYGFVLPANQILPTGVETFAAIKAMVQEMKV